MSEDKLLEAVRATVPTLLDALTSAETAAGLQGVATLHAMVVVVPVDAAGQPASNFVTVDTWGGDPYKRIAVCSQVVNAALQEVDATPKGVH